MCGGPRPLKEVDRCGASSRLRRRHMPSFGSSLVRASFITRFCSFSIDPQKKWMVLHYSLSFESSCARRYAWKRLMGCTPWGLSATSDRLQRCSRYLNARGIIHDQRYACGQVPIRFLIFSRLATAGGWLVRQDFLVSRRSGHRSG